MWSCPMGGTAGPQGMWSGEAATPARTVLFPMGAARRCWLSWWEERCPHIKTAGQHGPVSCQLHNQAEFICKVRTHQDAERLWRVGETCELWGDDARCRVGSVLSEALSPVLAFVSCQLRTPFSTEVTWGGLLSVHTRSNSTSPRPGVSASALLPPRRGDSLWGPLCVPVALTVMETKASGATQPVRPGHPACPQTQPVPGLQAHPQQGLPGGGSTQVKRQ